MSRRGIVFFDEKKAGILSEGEGGYHFQYDPGYLQDPEAVAVSLTLPLQSEVFKSQKVFPFFDGLIPEGWLLDIAQKNWKIDQRDRLGLLLSVCGDCIGAVRILPESSES